MNYAAFRPSYPAHLYNKVLAYHHGPKKLAIDLGCGTAIVTRELSKHFDHVIGTDPSKGMIEQARQQGSQLSNVEYREALAEASPFLEDGSVDMVVSGQAAHWFDFPKWFAEMKRVVRPGGTLAFWGYKDHVFVDSKRATDILNEFAYGDSEDLLGPYWPGPGRSYVQDKLRVIKPPPSEWESIQRIEYEPGTNGKHSGEGTPMMERSMMIGECKEYVRTWSSFHGWQEKHPEQIARSKGGSGDVMDEMFDTIAKDVEYFRDDEFVVPMEWGSALVMARRRE